MDTICQCRNNKLQKWDMQRVIQPVGGSKKMSASLPDQRACHLLGGQKSASKTNVRMFPKICWNQGLREEVSIWSSETRQEKPFSEGICPISWYRGFFIKPHRFHQKPTETSKLIE